MRWGAHLLVALLGTTLFKVQDTRKGALAWWKCTKGGSRYKGKGKGESTYICTRADFQFEQRRRSTDATGTASATTAVRRARLPVLAPLAHSTPPNDIRVEAAARGAFSLAPCDRDCQCQ